MHKFKIFLCTTIILTLATACVFFAYTKQWQPRHNTEVYYNRDTPLNQKIINTITNANEYVYFSIYTFTRDDIKDALLGAKYRGLDVRGVTDKKQYTEIPSQKKIINELRKAGIPIGLQNHDAIMHLKVIVTEQTYISGSYNWTASATTSNDEILEIGTSEPVRKQYYQIIRHIIEKYPQQ